MTNLRLHFNFVIRAVFLVLMLLLGLVSIAIDDPAPGPQALPWLRGAR